MRGTKRSVGNFMIAESPDLSCPPKLVKVGGRGFSRRRNNSEGVSTPSFSTRRVFELVARAVLFILALTGCEEKLKPTVSHLGQASLPSQESWRSTVVFSDSARVKAILWAGHIAVYTDKQYTVMDDSIHVDFFNEQEQHVSVLTARRGRVNDRTKDFVAHENVKVVSDSGTTLITDSLFWKNATRTIETEAYVEIISQTEHIRGEGLVSDQALKNYRISKVTGEAVIKEK